MKRFAFIFALIFISLISNAQKRSFSYSLFGGAGLATNNNNNVGVSGGIDAWWGKSGGAAIGLGISYNNYNVLYDKESGNIDYNGSVSGVSVLNQSSYAFISPMFIFDIIPSGMFKVYANVGYGYNISGTETLHKWENGNNFPLLPNPNYDSTINTSSNIHKSLYRVGTGLMQYAYLAGKWFFCFREDFGFLTSSLSTTSDANNPNRSANSPHSLNPIYCSFQIGISHHRAPR